MPWSVKQQEAFCHKLADDLRLSYARAPAHTHMTLYRTADEKIHFITLRREIIEDYYDELEGLIDALVS